MPIPRTIIRNPAEVKAAAAADKGMNKANYYIPQLVSPTIMYEDNDEGNIYVLQDKYLESLALKYHRMDESLLPRPLDIPDDAVYLKKYGSPQFNYRYSDPAQ